MHIWYHCFFMSIAIFLNLVYWMHVWIGPIQIPIVKGNCEWMINAIRNDSLKIKLKYYHTVDKYLFNTYSNSVLKTLKNRTTNSLKLFNWQEKYLFKVESTWLMCWILRRSSTTHVFCKKGVLKSFAKLFGKQLRRILFFNNVEGFQPAALLKKRFWRSCFPVNFSKILRISLL